jgi:hypothetical protein
MYRPLPSARIIQPEDKAKLDAICWLVFYGLPQSERSLACLQGVAEAGSYRHVTADCCSGLVELLGGGNPQVIASLARYPKEPNPAKADNTHIIYSHDVWTLSEKMYKHPAVERFCQAAGACADSYIEQCKRDGLYVLEQDRAEFDPLSWPSGVLFRPLTPDAVADFQHRSDSPRMLFERSSQILTLRDVHHQTLVQTVVEHAPHLTRNEITCRALCALTAQKLGFKLADIPALVDRLIERMLA